MAIYDTRIKPSEKDTAATVRIEYLTYDQLSENFESLYDKISWDAVDLGKFDTYYEGTKDKRGTETVDDDILNIIEKWRTVLAEDIALHNKEIDGFNLTGAVQKNYRPAALLTDLCWIGIMRKRGVRRQRRRGLFTKMRQRKDIS